MAEGARSPADLFITVDAGRLAVAVEKGLFQPIGSDVVKAAIPGPSAPRG
jgi:iron(III) transport system substrate-binding protein